MVLNLKDKKAHEIIAEATAKYPNLTTLEALDEYKSNQLLAIHTAQKFIPQSKLEELADHLRECDRAREIVLSQTKVSECL